MIKIAKGDNVLVISGKYKNNIKKVIDIKNCESNAIVYLEGLTFTRCMRKNRNGPGKKVVKNIPIDISNVSYFDVMNKMRSKLGYIIKNNKKLRVLKKNNKIL